MKSSLQLLHYTALSFQAERYQRSKQREKYHVHGLEDNTVRCYFLQIDMYV